MKQVSKFQLLALFIVVAVVATFFVPTLPKSIYAQDPAPQKIEAEDGQVAQAGTWQAQPANAASGGSYLYNSGEATLSLNFAGTSLEVIYVGGPSLGTLAIEVDGTVLRTVITTAEKTEYGQVAKIDYLTDEPHELKVYAQGGGVIAVDAFVLMPSDPEETRLVTNEINGGQPRLCDPSNTVHIVSLSSGGVIPTAGSYAPAVSYDGRYAAYTSEASTLVAGDTNNRRDVFLRDRMTCTTTRLSVATDGTQGNRESYSPSISDDGRYVVFESTASNLVPNDTNAIAILGCHSGQCPDIFLHDHQTSTTISPSVTGTGGSYRATAPTISASGNTIAYLLTQVTGQDETHTLVVYDRPSGTTTTYPSPDTRFFGSVRISPNDEYIAYSLRSSGGPSEVRQITVLELASGLTEVISVSPTGQDGNGASDAGDFSANGQYISFHSNASNLVTAPYYGLYWRDLQTDTTYAIPVGSHVFYHPPRMSRDGRYMVFRENGSVARFYDRETNMVTPILNYTGGLTAVGGPVNISGDGRYAAYDTHTSVAPNSNGWLQAYLAPTGVAAPAPGDKLALFDATTNTVGLVETLDATVPPSAIRTYIANPPADANDGQWAMGDWDGDGHDTPGVYADSGAFYYTNATSNNTTWSSVWVGLLGRPPVSGRFDNAVNHDCIGAVDNGEFPPYGTAFALYFTCDLTNNTAPTLTFQWLSVVLPDSGGFLGTHQFAAGDFDNNGVDSIAIRRGEFIAFGNVPPTTLLSEFNLAQYWGTPTTTGGDYGVFLTGDFDNVAGDSFGVFYQNGNFYFRNAVDWFPAPHTLQSVGQPIGTPVYATSWR